MTNDPAAVMTAADTRRLMRELRACVIIPAYNNVATIVAVAEAACQYADSVFIVDDGSTDGTASAIMASAAQVHLISHDRNRGKGRALRTGFRAATSAGFDYAVTLDGDGQHYPHDLPLVAEAARQHRGALIVGSRVLRQENMPGRNTFANQFSNFWFAVQTGQRLPDTQTGFRLYPLRRLSSAALLLSRYETELALLVMAAWRGVPLIPVPIRVYYPPRDKRVTHFRPVADFARISVLNVVLCLLAVVYGWPSLLWRKLIKGRTAI